MSIIKVCVGNTSTSYTSCLYRTAWNQVWFPGPPDELFLRSDKFFIVNCSCENIDDCDINKRLVNQKTSKIFGKIKNNTSSDNEYEQELHLYPKFKTITKNMKYRTFCTGYKNVKEKLSDEEINKIFKAVKYICKNCGKCEGIIR